ncbi:hypothetical protein PYCC9005_004772 [Savitreella phatthalungensis]
MPETQYFKADDFPLASGQSADLVLAYRTYGDRSLPCILQPTCYGGKLEGTTCFIAEGEPLDPAKHFVVVVALLCNGESSSPSHMEGGDGRLGFPVTTYADNVRLQHLLLTSHLGVDKCKAVVGFSMGGQQVYHHLAMFPGFFNAGITICSSAATSWHNYVFLEGPRNALLASADYNDGKYEGRPARGLAAFGRAYSAWALSPGWFASKTWTSLDKEFGSASAPKYDDVDAYLKAQWEGWAGWDAQDLLHLSRTWQLGTIGFLQGVPADVDFSVRAEDPRAKEILLRAASQSQDFKDRESVDEVLKNRITDHVLSTMPKQSTKLSRPAHTPKSPGSQSSTRIGDISQEVEESYAIANSCAARSPASSTQFRKHRL